MAEMDFNKRRQSVNQLTDICEMESSSLSSNIAKLGPKYDGLKHITQLETTDLCGLHPEDFLIYTHNYDTSGTKPQFVTNKITIADLEYLLYEFRLSALAVDIRNGLNLQELAYRTEDSLNLQAMSHKPHVVSSDLFHPTTGTPKRSIGLEAIDCDWDQLLKSKANVVAPELRLSSLAYKDNIDYDPLRYDELVHEDKRWPIDKIISNAGELATRSYDSLDLQALAHVGSLDLTDNYGFGTGKYIHGYLDFSNVSNYEDKIHQLVLKYLPLATTSNVGVVKLNNESKYPKYPSHPRDYSVKMENGLSTLYTTVPWVDTNTLSTFTLEAGGPNTLVFKGYGIDKSLDVSTNVRKNEKSSEPIYSQTIQLTPYIERNVILSQNVVVRQTEDHKRCLARFSPARNHLEIEEGPSFEDGKEKEYLGHDGIWHQFPMATATQPGMVTKDDLVFIKDMQAKQAELDGNFYVLPVAQDYVLGGIKTGYNTNANLGLYAVKLDSNNNAYVNVPKPTDAGKIAGDSIAEMLRALYPVGAIYITVNTTCPLATLIPGSEWTSVAKGRCLWGYNGSTSLGGTIEAGLPDHYHSVTYQVANCGCGNDGGIRSSHSSSKHGTATTTAASASNKIYGKSTTVQPPAYVVNMFQRTK